MQSVKRLARWLIRQGEGSTGASLVRGFMNDALKMQISAFVDGELSDNEAEFLLRRLSQDAAMRQQVASFSKLGG